MFKFGSSFRPEWMDDPRVKCNGLTGVVYPENPSPGVSQAKALCNGLDGKPACIYKETCLRHAIDHHEAYGVWGGTSERDRRKIQRARNKYKNPHIYSLEDVRFPYVVLVKPRPIVTIKRRVS